MSISLSPMAPFVDKTVSIIMDYAQIESESINSVEAEKAVRSSLLAYWKKPFAEEYVQRLISSGVLVLESNEQNRRFYSLLVEIVEQPRTRIMIDRITLELQRVNKKWTIEEPKEDSECTEREQTYVVGIEWPKENPSADNSYYLTEDVMGSWHLQQTRSLGMGRVLVHEIVHVHQKVTKAEDKHNKLGKYESGQSFNYNPNEALAIRPHEKEELELCECGCTDLYTENEYACDVGENARVIHSSIELDRKYSSALINLFFSAIRQGADATLEKILKNKAFDILAAFSEVNEWGFPSIARPLHIELPAAGLQDKFYLLQNQHKERIFKMIFDHLNQCSDSKIQKIIDLFKTTLKETHPTLQAFIESRKKNSA